MSGIRFLALLMVSITVYGYPVSAGVVGTITEEVATEFGTYRPVPVTVVPSVAPYEVKEGLSDVVNIRDFELDGRTRELLAENGFAAVAGGYRRIYDVYNECKELGIPVFVTTDACLHTYHILYDYVLRVIELNHFVSDLRELTAALVDDMRTAYESAADTTVKRAALEDLAYLSVALGLLDPDAEIDPRVSDVVSREHDLIMEGSPGYVPSPLFHGEDYPYLEDYSQYKPRGHYTRTPELERYFRAMMWYGRITFSLNLPFASQEGIRHAAVQALLLCRSLENTRIEGGVPGYARDMWRKIYEPTVFFVGKADDINHDAYLELAAERFGKDFTRLSPDVLADTTVLDGFIADALEKLPAPKITVKAGKGYRFMGQRFIPDSYILDQLVDEFVRNRWMPRGLDVMAALGSDRAYEIIDTVYHDPETYPMYDGQLAKLREEVGGYPPETWAQNLYYNWLYTLAPLLETKGEGYPAFMRNTAWTDKNLNTALGSWAELRHDTILYAKQSETFERAAETPALVTGYVEPEPEVFARLAALASFTRRGLGGKGLLDGLFEGRLTDFEELMLSLKTIAEKELRNVAPTAEESALMCDFGTLMEELTTFPSSFGKQYENEADDFMAVIADVHTDPNTDECLEVGVGHPLDIYVIAPVNGVPTLTKGGIFSYHEFRRSLADGRLTDEEWQKLQSGPDAVGMPAWTSGFLAGESSLKRETVTFPSNPAPVTSVEEEEETAPGPFVLLRCFPNPFNPSTTVVYRLPGSGTVNVAVYNCRGQLVDVLVDAWHEAGSYTVRWTPDDCGAGIYFVRLSSCGHSDVVKVLFLK